MVLLVAIIYITCSTRLLKCLPLQLQATAKERCFSAAQVSECGAGHGAYVFEVAGRENRA